MGFELSERVTASGMAYLCVEASEAVALADVEALALRLQQPSEVLPKVLSLVRKGTDYGAAARQRLVNLDRDYSAMAVVVTSAIVRAAINLMLRTQSGHSGPVRLFADEAGALAWLEEQPPRRRAEAERP